MTPTELLVSNEIYSGALGGGKTITFKNYVKNKLKSMGVDMSEDKCKKGYGEHDYSVVNSITKTVNCVNCGNAKMSEDKTVELMLLSYREGDLYTSEVIEQIEEYYRKKFADEWYKKIMSARVDMDGHWYASENWIKNVLQPDKEG